MFLHIMSWFMINDFDTVAFWRHNVSNNYSIVASQSLMESLVRICVFINYWTKLFKKTLQFITKPYFILLFMYKKVKDLI